MMTSATATVAAASTAAGSARPPLPADIPARDIDFSADLRPEDVPRTWFADDPFATAMVSGLSVLFPDGESFFVEAVRSCRHAVSDEDLAARVSAFVLQEAMHGKGHRGFNEMLAAQGHEVAVADFEAETRALLGFFRKHLPPMSRLAVTCALEHFTALLGEDLLTNPELRECLHPSIAPLWLWHAIEETEHKTVAFDVFEANEGGYVHRNGIMIVTTLIFLAMMARGAGHFRASQRAQAEARPNPVPPSLTEEVAGWRRVASFIWGKPGIFRKLVPGYLTYFRPGFHPDDRDTRELVGMWRERLFGADGPLAGRVTPLRGSPEKFGRGRVPPHAVGSPSSQSFAAEPA